MLADALAHALDARHGATAPVIDFATLTGAARVALGPELPALFCHDDALAASLLEQARRVADPLWRLPLWQPYRAMLKSSSADLQNAAANPHAGAITAALFCRASCRPARPAAHGPVRTEPGGAPGRPRGGEAQSLRALAARLCERFGGAGGTPGD